MMKGGAILKKYLVFIISFILLNLVFQIGSGVFLTATYTPNFSSIEGDLSQEVVFEETNQISFLVTLITATLVYFFSQKLFRT